MFKCEICDKTFKNKSGLSGHVKSKHGIPWTEYQKEHTVVKILEDKEKPGDKADEGDEASEGSSLINDRLDRMEAIINESAQQEGETEDKDEKKDEVLPIKFSDDTDIDELMTRTLLIHATPILKKIALNSKVFLQHEYFQKQLGYEGDVGDLLVEALNFYWEEMGFTIKITHDMVM